MEEMGVRILEIIIEALEFMGITVITIGAIRAFWHYIKARFGKGVYSVKHELAEAMAMGLEFKLAAEILKTTIVQSLQEIAVLGAIFLLRALMTVIINWEIKQEKSNHPEQILEDKKIEPDAKEAMK